MLGRSSGFGVVLSHVSVQGQLLLLISTMQSQAVSLKFLPGLLMSAKTREIDQPRAIPCQPRSDGCRVMLRQEYRWEFEHATASGGRKRISTVNSLKIQIHPKSDVFSCLLLRWVQQNYDRKAGIWMTHKCCLKMGRRTVWVVLCFKEKRFLKIVLYLVYFRMTFAFSRADWISISIKENGTWLLIQPHYSPTNENEFCFHQRGLH